MTDERAEYPIRPTGLPVSDNYSDIALTGLLNVHASQINSERQTFWQRYNVMLIANSVIFGFLAGGTLTTTEIIYGVTLGLVLCVAWFIILVSGWRLFLTRRDRALRFSWTHLDPEANPLEPGIAYERGIPGGWIYIMARFVIFVFMTGQVLLLVRQLIYP